MIPYALLTHPERLAVQLREAQMLADLRDLWRLRMLQRLRQPLEGWSHYDREVNRHHSDFDRENYGL
jgi:hypothetical protein